MDRTGKFRFFVCPADAVFSKKWLLQRKPYLFFIPTITDTHGLGCAISRGIAKVFDQRDKEVNIYVEYLDAKRASPNRFTSFSEK